MYWKANLNITKIALKLPTHDPLITYRYDLTKNSDSIIIVVLRIICVILLTIRFLIIPKKRVGEMLKIQLPPVFPLPLFCHYELL